MKRKITTSIFLLLGFYRLAANPAKAQTAENWADHVGNEYEMIPNITHRTANNIFKETFTLR